jgi:hypothetical protein
VIIATIEATRDAWHVEVVWDDVVFASLEQPSLVQASQYVDELVERWGIRAGVIVPASRHRRPNVPLFVKCIGEHGCGSIARQTNAKDALQRLVDHESEHEPTPIPIREAACRR